MDLLPHLTLNEAPSDSGRYLFGNSSESLNTGTPAFITPRENADGFETFFDVSIDTVKRQLYCSHPELISSTR